MPIPQSTGPPTAAAAARSARRARPTREDSSSIIRVSGTVARPAVRGVQPVTTWSCSTRKNEHRAQRAVHQQREHVRDRERPGREQVHRHQGVAVPRARRRRTAPAPPRRATAAVTTYAVGAEPFSISAYVAPPSPSAPRAAPSDVEAAGGLGVAGLGHVPRGDQQHGHRHRHVDQEDPAPAGVADDPAAEQRPDRGRDAAEPDQADHLAAVGGAERALDHGQAARASAGPRRRLAGAGPRSASSGVWASPQTSDADREPGDADHEDPLAAEVVAERAADQDQRRQRERVGVDTHCSWRRVAPRSSPTSRSAMLTTVPSSIAMPEPSTAAASTHRPCGRPWAMPASGTAAAYRSDWGIAACSASPSGAAATAPRDGRRSRASRGTRRAAAPGGSPPGTTAPRSSCPGRPSPAARSRSPWWPGRRPSGPGAPRGAGANGRRRPRTGRSPIRPRCPGRARRPRARRAPAPSGRARRRRGTGTRPREDVPSPARLAARSRSRRGIRSSSVASRNMSLIVAYSHPPRHPALVVADLPLTRRLWLPVANHSRRVSPHSANHSRRVGEKKTGLTVCWWGGHDGPVSMTAPRARRRSARARCGSGSWTPRSSAWSSGAGAVRRPPSCRSAPA